MIVGKRRLLSHFEVEKAVLKLRIYLCYFNMKIISVKTPVIVLLFHHRSSENNEKNREGSLYLSKSYD